jgi:hypothetical protein
MRHFAQRVGPGSAATHAGGGAPGTPRSSAAETPPAFAPAPVAGVGTARAVWSAAIACGRAWVMESWRDVSPEVWRSAFHDAAHDHRFFEVIERALRKQFDPRYFVLENRPEGRFAGATLFPGAPGFERRLTRQCGPDLTLEQRSNGGSDCQA